MALEAAVYSQDQPVINYNCYKEYTNTGLCGLGVGGGGYEYPSPWSYDLSNHNIEWDDHQEQERQFVNASYSSPELGNNYCGMEHQYNDLDLSGEAPPAAGAVAVGGGKRKRRRRSCKNKEEVEQQRMTHIAVERNRRRQMNDYLAVVRSLMPPSYSQRGDQASIVGGAINYVKELEQTLQSLEAQKRTKVQDLNSNSSRSRNNSLVDDHSRLFGKFFNFPQYSSHNHYRNQPTTSGNNSNSSSSNNNAALSSNEIEVIMVDGHANVRILAKKHPKQLLRLVAAFQGLRVSVLHLNVTTADPFVLYSFNLKVEEGCQLNSVDDVAAAANHILVQIQEEAAVLLQ